MVIQDEMAKSQEDKNLRSTKVMTEAEITAHIIERTDRATNEYLDDWLTRLKKHNNVISPKD